MSKVPSKNKGATLSPVSHRPAAPLPPSLRPAAALPVNNVQAPCPHAIVHAKLEIDAIQFKNHFPMNCDMYGRFSSPEWRTGVPDTPKYNAVGVPAYNSPVCFARNQKIALELKLKVVQKPSKAESVSIKGEVMIDNVDMAFVGSVNVNQEDFVYIQLQASTALINCVDYYDNFEIKWEYTAPSMSSAIAGKSSHLVYVLLGAPTYRPYRPYWTLIDISCRAAKGATTEDEFVKRSFEAFTQTLGDGNGIKRLTDGKELSYYLQGSNTPGNHVYACEDLLRRPDGTGRCGAWARFLVAMHQIHGVTSSRNIGVMPKATRNMIIKNWSFPNKSTLTIPSRSLAPDETEEKNAVDGSPYIRVTRKVLPPVLAVPAIAPLPGVPGRAAVPGRGPSDREPKIDDRVALPFSHTGKRNQGGCQKTDGLPGQGKTNPQMTFGDHALVKHSTGIYDPSYGTRFDDLLAWEKAAVSGIGGCRTFNFQDNSHCWQFAPERCSLGFFIHKASKGEKLDSIAAKYNINNWADLYNHPYNKAFREAHKDSSIKIVKEGDILFIPRELAPDFPLMYQSS